MIRIVRHTVHFLGMRLLQGGVLQCRIGTWLAKHSGLLCLPVDLQYSPPPPPSKQKPARLALVHLPPTEVLPDKNAQRIEEINAIRHAMDERLREIGIIIQHLDEVLLALQNLNNTRQRLGDELNGELARRSVSAQ